MENMASVFTPNMVRCIELLQAAENAVMLRYVDCTDNYKTVNFEDIRKKFIIDIYKFVACFFMCVNGGVDV